MHNVQDALAKEKAQFEEIIASLKNEGERRVAKVSSELKGVRDLAAHEKTHRHDLERRIKELEVRSVCDHCIMNSHTMYI